MGGLSLWHWLIVLVIVVLVFGTKRLKQRRQGPGRSGQGLQEGHERRRQAGRQQPARRRRRDEVARRDARRPRAAKPRDDDRTPAPIRRADAAPGNAAMFDIGFSELLVIAVVALLVLGPERLPKAARFAGLWVRRRARSGIR